MYGYLQLAYHLFYIFYPFLIPKIIANRFKGQKYKTHLEWSSEVCRYFNVKFNQIGTIPRQFQQRCIYLFNHRTTADFFLHDVICEGTASYLARYLVGLIFIPTLFFKQTIWFFRRNSIKDFQSFYQWLDSQFQLSPRQNLIVYPQGHRSQDKMKSGQLKVGMLKYAYSRQLKVQICITFGNDKIIQQYPPRIDRSGSTVWYSFDKAIYPSQYLTQYQFIQVIRERFDKKIYQILQQTSYQKAKL